MSGDIDGKLEAEFDEDIDEYFDQPYIDIRDGSTLRIGAVDYTVKELNLAEGSDGVCSFGDCELQINSALCPQASAQVLWHEVIHAILINAGIPPEKHIERLVNALSFGLIQVLRDNPGMRVL